MGTSSMMQTVQQTEGKLPVRLSDAYDAVEGVTKLGMLQWDTVALGWVKFTGVGGVGGGGGGGPATIADGADVTQGAKADAAWDGIAAAPSRQAIDKAQWAKLEAIRALLAGTVAIAGPVTVSNFPATQPVSLAAAVDVSDRGVRALGVVTTADGGQATVGAKADATWDGAAAAPSGISIWKYVASKIEAVRALLAGTLRVTESARVIAGAYRCGSGQIAGAASAQNLISIENPTGSGKTVWVKRIEVQGPTVTVSLTLKFLYLMGRTTALPTVGTTLTSQKGKSSYPAPVAIVRQGPTATAATGNMWSTAGEQLFTAVGAGNAIQNIALGENRETDDIDLQPGEAILIRAETNNTGYFHSIDISWEEGT